jgi:LysR family nitrogen assimilation transcriptional regulator
MDTNQLRAFLKIAEFGSITRAAMMLGLAQPSLSQQLLRLEDEVGFQLFRRTARGVALTEAGRVFQEHARQILRDSEQALADVRQLKAVASGEVVLAVPHTVCKLIGLQLVETLADEAPDIRLRLMEAFGPAIRSGLEAGTIDIGVLHDRTQQRHLTSRKLVGEELFLVGPPGRFGASLGEAPAVSSAELGGFPLITPGDQHDLRFFLDREAARIGFDYRLAMEIEAVGLVLELVSRGRGFTILPLPAVEDGLAAGKLSIARLGDGSLCRTLCVMRSRAKLVTHASVFVEDLMIQIVAGLVEAGRWHARMLNDTDE